jgi:hypothetical protein
VNDCTDEKALCIRDNMMLPSFIFLPGSSPARAPPSVVFKLWLPIMPRLGDASRPASIARFWQATKEGAVTNLSQMADDRVRGLYRQRFEVTGSSGVRGFQRCRTI